MLAKIIIIFFFLSILTFELCYLTGSFKRHIMFARMLVEAYLLKSDENCWLIKRSPDLWLGQVEKIECQKDYAGYKCFIFETALSKINALCLKEVLGFSKCALPQKAYFFLNKDFSFAFLFADQIKKISFYEKSLLPLPAPLKSLYFAQYLFYNNSLVLKLELEKLDQAIKTAGINYKPAYPTFDFWQEAETENRQLIIFRRHKQLVALAGELKAIYYFRKSKFYHFPYSLPLMSGLYEQCSALIPVFDLALLGESRVLSSPNELVILILVAGRLIALAANQFINYLAFEKENLVPLPSEKQNPWFKSLYNYKDCLIPLLERQVFTIKKNEIKSLKLTLASYGQPPEIDKKHLLDFSPKSQVEKLTADKQTGFLGLEEIKTNSLAEELRASYEPQEVKNNEMKETFSGHLDHYIDSSLNLSSPKNTKAKLIKFKKFILASLAVIFIPALAVGVFFFFDYQQKKSSSFANLTLPQISALPTLTLKTSTPTPYSTQTQEEGSAVKTYRGKELFKDEKGYFYIYEVKPGDFLANIAWQETGRYENFYQIAIDNSILDPNLILPRQRLKIYLKIEY